MIELLTQIVILLTAVVGLVKLTEMKRREKPDDNEKPVKMELPSWLQGLGDLVIKGVRVVDFRLTHQELRPY